MCIFVQYWQRSSFYCYTYLTAVPFKNIWNTVRVFFKPLLHSKVQTFCNLKKCGYIFLLLFIFLNKTFLCYLCSSLDKQLCCHSKKVTQHPDSPQTSLFQFGYDTKLRYFRLAKIVLLFQHSNCKANCLNCNLSLWNTQHRKMKGVIMVSLGLMWDLGSCCQLCLHETVFWVLAENRHSESLISTHALMPIPG